MESISKHSFKKLITNTYTQPNQIILAYGILDKIPTESVSGIQYIKSNDLIEGFQETAFLSLVTQFLKTHGNYLVKAQI